MKKTRYKDRSGLTICAGDILDVCEYPDNYVAGSLDYRGLCAIENGLAVCVYLDIGVEESTRLCDFPRRGRRICNEEERRLFWRGQMLGEEPPEYLWKEELYRDHFGKDAEEDAGCERRC